MIRVTLYPAGKVQPLSEGQAMSHLFSMLKAAGLRVEGSASRFEAADDQTVLVVESLPVAVMDGGL